MSHWPNSWLKYHSSVVKILQLVNSLLFFQLYVVLCFLNKNHVGISGCCASMCNVPNLPMISGFKVHSYICCSSDHFIFIPFHFVVYRIYMRTCTIATHLFASATPRDNRKYYFLPFLDHAALISTNQAIFL